METIDDEEKKQETTEEVKTESLEDSINDEEEDLQPPEEEAKQLNTGNIFLIAFAAIGILLVVFLFFGNNKKKKAEEEKQLKESGTKTEFNIDFKEKTKSSQSDYQQDNYDDTDNTPNEDKESNADEILATLPDDLQLNYSTESELPKAPVSPVGSTNTSSSSTRPDTRNSRSPRKIDGIKGLNYTGNKPIDNLMNGSVSQNQQYVSQSPLPSKDEYIDKQLKMIKEMQAPYLNNNQTPQQQYQTNKEQFFSNSGSSSRGYYLSNTSLWDGTVISGALMTAINTDNPGIVIARVTENVWSSYDHSFLLIPEGSLLYATYNSSVNYGQDKVQVAWNLLIRPDGYRIELGNMNGVNAQGMSGYDGSVSNHPWETLKALGLVAVYSILQTEITGQIEDANNKYIQNAITDVYSQASSIGNRILDKALDIKPTIKIKEGTEIKLITNIPLELPPVAIPEVSRKYIRTK